MHGMRKYLNEFGLFGMLDYCVVKYVGKRTAAYGTV